MVKDWQKIGKRLAKDLGNLGMFHLSFYSLHTFKKFKKFLKCYQSIDYQCFKLRTDLLNFSNLVNLAKKV